MICPISWRLCGGWIAYLGTLSQCDTKNDSHYKCRSQWSISYTSCSIDFALYLEECFMDEPPDASYYGIMSQYDAISYLQSAIQACYAVFRQVLFKMSTSVELWPIVKKQIMGMDPVIRSHGMKAGPPGYLCSKYECFPTSGFRDMTFWKTCI